LELEPLEKLIKEILVYERFSIADFDLTMDVAGHLDY
jgi:hypothetical protein